jgi:hypothetical protein
MRCLECCKQLLSQANELFSVAPSSDVIREIVADEQGYQYIKGAFLSRRRIGHYVPKSFVTNCKLLMCFIDTVAVYRVYSRISNATRRAGEDSRIVDLDNQIQSGWETLISFFLGTSVLVRLLHCSFTGKFLELRR